MSGKMFVLALAALLAVGGISTAIASIVNSGAEQQASSIELRKDDAFDDVDVVDEDDDDKDKKKDKDKSGNKGDDTGNNSRNNTRDNTRNTQSVASRNAAPAPAPPQQAAPPPPPPKPKPAPPRADDSFSADTRTSVSNT